MSKRHRHNLAKLNHTRKWRDSAVIQVEQRDRHHAAFRREKDRRNGPDATGADILTGHALDVAVVECMEIHIPCPEEDPQFSKDWTGVTLEQLQDEAFRAAFMAFHEAWEVKWGPSRGITWGSLNYRKIEPVNPFLVTPEVPSYFADEGTVWVFRPDRGWHMFSPTSNDADAQEVFQLGSHKVHGGGNLSFDGDCFDLPEWTCTFSGGRGSWEGTKSDIHVVGAVGWGSDYRMAVCRAYVHDMVVVQAEHIAWLEANREMLEARDRAFLRAIAV